MNKKHVKNIWLLIHVFTLYLLLLSQQRAKAQPANNQPLGAWTSYHSYVIVNAIAEAPDRIYAGTESALFSYHKTDHSTQVYTRVDGFSDLNIVALGYSDTTAALLIAYQSADLDILKNNQITNISDIKRAAITPNKKINHIHIDKHLAYLSCNFGIVVIDLDKEEVKDTYIIGQSGSLVEVFQVATNDHLIMAATETGVLSASLSSNLANFNTWQQQADLPVGKAKQIAYAHQQFFANINDMLFATEDNENWLPVYGNANWVIKSLESHKNQLLATEWRQEGNNITTARLSIIETNQEVRHITGNEMLRPIQALSDGANNIWIADNWRSLLQIKNEGAQGYTRIVPNGPNSNSVFEIATRGNEVWVLPGGITNSWDGQDNRDGFYQLQNGNWTHFNQFSHPILTNKLDFAVPFYHPQQAKIYFGSYGQGLIEYDGTEMKHFDGSNSTLALANGDVETRIAGLAMDAQNNLWISNYGAPSPLSVQTSEGEWYAFNPPMALEEDGLHEMVIDDFDQKWILVKRDGILVYHHGEDLASPDDDFYKHLTNSEGNGNLPDRTVNCMAKDKDGHIWVGTENGIAVFYCSFAVFQESGCNATRPFVEVDGFGAYLLDGEVVTDIAIDGANRKWVGTANGLWLLSADGTQQINYFTKENSPLLSNVILSIAINDDSGEVYIGTDRGMVSYKGDATLGSPIHGDIITYPNPVRPDYEGPIAIKGLANNAYVKITDISGTLVYETRALGSQAIWDGKDYNGRRASTGVYLILSTSEDGSDSKAGKFLIVN